MSTPDRIAEIRRILTQPMSSTGICTALNISQSLFSRLSKNVPGLVALGAARSRRYGIERMITGVVLPITITVVSPTGAVGLLGVLHALEGGWYALARIDSSEYFLYQGLPPFVKDLRPQGFLGQLEPLKYIDLELPVDILLWTEDHVLKYLAHRSEHAAGNLVLGDESLARYWESRRLDNQLMLKATACQQEYPQLAQAAMKGELVGSSAGGEQPKFTCIIQRGHDGADFTHVIVKFSPPVTTPGGRRWADLLICEHLALSTLERHRLPAALTSVLRIDERVFLQVARFDRDGRYGRKPMVTLSALDGDLGMLDRSWSAVAKVLQAERQLPPEDVRLVEILDLYGALIGNVDKHHGNIAVSWDLTPQYRLLPAYDVLPMLYRPNSHGEVVDREWSDFSLRGMQLAHLPLCYQMAESFWASVIADERISADFKSIAARHMEAIASLKPAS